MDNGGFGELVGQQLQALVVEETSEGPHTGMAARLSHGSVDEDLLVHLDNATGFTLDPWF